jgi:hypothetical protein
VEFFIWLEDTAASVWIRETPSLWGFPFILFLHTLGLALIAGLSSAVALAHLFWSGELQRVRLKGLFDLMWIGLAINALSGLALLIAYPAKAMTNPVFYIKLAAIAIAVVIVQRFERQFAVAGDSENIPSRATAWALLGLWCIAIVTGRLLAYTHSILMAGVTGFY